MNMILCFRKFWQYHSMYELSAFCGSSEMARAASFQSPDALLGATIFSYISREYEPSARLCLRVFSLLQGSGFTRFRLASSDIRSSDQIMSGHFIIQISNERDVQWAFP